MWRKIRILLWKSLRTRKRNKVHTFLEMFVPCLLFVFINYARSKFTASGGVGMVNNLVTNKSILTLHTEDQICNYFSANLSSGYFIYAPNTTEAGQIMKNVAKYLNISSYNIGVARDETDMVRMFKNVYLANNFTGIDESEFLGFGIVFEEIRKSHVFKYKIRSTKNVWRANRLFPASETPGPMDSGKDYFFEGFLALQLMLDKIFINLHVSENMSDVTDYRLKLLPYPYTNVPHSPEAHSVLDTYLSTFLFVSFLVICTPVITKIAEEKHSGVKEFTKLLGLKSGIAWTGWFLHNVVAHSITITFISFICCFEMFSGQGTLFNYTSPLLLWIFLLMYLISGTLFTFTFSSVIRLPSLSLTAVIAAWIASFVLPYICIKPTTSSLVKLLLMLLPNTAANFGVKAILSLESMGVGLQFSTVFTTKQDEDSFSVGLVLFMFVFDCFLYGYIAWYLDSVVPGKHGVAKPLSFVFKRCRSRSTASNICNLTRTKDDKYFEDPPGGYSVGLCIRNLCKRYGNSNVVNGVNIDLYKGQITALLGHNGAGKTTTVSIITGLISRSSGIVEFEGCDIFRHINYFRDKLGVCPQHDLHFSYLTTMDHLIFYGMLKGLPEKEAKAGGIIILNRLNIWDKKDVHAGKLSGGMKKMLSLAIALVGDPDILILDEPTSGMDPVSRRAMWDFLLSAKRNRTILVTTSFMEEADFLGDRIAIMDRGRIKCYGTPLFLKNLYGSGYNLTIAKGETLNVSTVMEETKKILPKALLYKSEDAKLIINLPYEKVEMFPELFKMLESKKKEFDIIGMGVSCTTMEEVFLRVGKDTIVDDDDDDDDDDVDVDVDDNSPPEEEGDDYQLILNKNFDCDNGVVCNFVGQYVPGWSIMSNTSLLLILNLPAREKKNFSSLYAALKAQQQNLKLTKYKIVNPHLGDALSMLSDDNGHGEELNNSPADDYSIALLPTYANGTELLINQLKVLLEKNFLYSKRRLLMTIIFGILPILLGATTVAFSYRSFSSSVNFGSLKLSLSTYKDSFSYYRTGDESFENVGPYFASVANENNVIINKVPSENHIINDLLKICAQDTVKYRTNIMIAGDFNQTNSTLIYNNIAIHTPAIAVNAYTNALLRKISGNSDSYISVVNEPLIIQHSITMCDTNDTSLLTTIWLMVLSTGFLLSMVYFIPLPLSERVSGIKHLQIMSTLSPFMYWASIFIWDYFCYTIVVVLTLTVMCFFDSFHMFMSTYELSILLILMLIYGLSAIFYTYIYSFFNKTLLGSTFCFLMINSVLGFIINMVLVNYKTLALYMKLLDPFHLLNVMKYVLLFMFPNYSFSSCIAGYLLVTWENNKCTLCQSSVTSKECSINSNRKSYFVFASEENPNGILEETLYLFFSSFFYVAMILLFDYKVFARLYQLCFNKIVGTNVGYKGDFVDPNVNNEVTKVNAAKKNFSNDASSPLLLVDNLVKKFNLSSTGVRGVSFGVWRGERFGLLGVNGAGKTTTLQMLTGDITPSKGGAFIRADKLYNLKSFINQYISMIGYCPQFDALNEKLTGSELLKIMAILRGISPTNVQEHVDKWTNLLSLKEPKDKPSGLYSGCNKRKLNIAIALIGDPPIVFLDEPTNGVDASTRRNLWKLLATSQKDGQVIILASNSMDECEALCNRLAIMVDGVIKCIGNVQCIKNRYGQGFTIMIKLKNIEDEMVAEIKANLEFKFASQILLKDERKGFLHYHVTNPNLPFSEVFGRMKTLKSVFLSIENYTIEDMTLEQVFVAFTKKQPMIKTNV